MGTIHPNIESSLLQTYEAPAENPIDTSWLTTDDTYYCSPEFLQELD